MLNLAVEHSLREQKKNKKKKIQFNSIAFRGIKRGTSL
jgi:hypothetical protein